jgi:hypothetical protein
MDGELVPVPAELHSDTITVPTLRATLRCDRPDPDRLRLVGQLDGQLVVMSAERVDLNRFTLRNRGFHWIQEYPYFR